MKKTIKPKKKNKGLQKNIAGLVAKLTKVEDISKRLDLPEFFPGDTVRVHVKIKEGEKERIQAYEGVVIKKGNKGASKSFNVRKMSHGVGVERIFLESSPRISKLEVVQSGKVRRAKLYYIRELEGRAARIKRQVESSSQIAAKAAAKAEAKAAKADKK